MIELRVRYMVMALLAIGGWLGAAPADAQRFPVIAGGELRIGQVWPEGAQRGLSAGADVDLGRFLPGIRINAGVQGFNADIDRTVGDERLTGTVNARAVRVGGRFAPLGPGTFAPYLGAGLTAYNLGGDPDVAAQRALFNQLYSGTNLGTSLSVGAVYPLEPTRQLLGVLEARREWSGNIDHWALEIGGRLRLRPDPSPPLRPRP